MLHLGIANSHDNRQIHRLTTVTLAHVLRVNQWIKMHIPSGAAVNEKR